MGGGSSRDLRGHHRGSAGGGLLHPHGHRPDDQAAGDPHRGLGPLRTGLRPRGHRPVRAARLCQVLGRDGRTAVRRDRRRPSTSAARCPVPATSGCGRPGSTPSWAAISTTTQVVGYLEPIGFACDRVGAGAAGRHRPHLPARHRRGRSTSSKRWPAITATAPCPDDGRPPLRWDGSPATRANAAWSGRSWPVSGPTKPGRRRCWPRVTMAGPVWATAGVEVANPLTPDETVLRRSLSAGDAQGPGLQRRPPAGRRPLVRGGPRLPPARRPSGWPGPSAAAVRRSSTRGRWWRPPSPGAATTPARPPGAWLALADALGIVEVEVVQSTPATGRDGAGVPGGLHPTRAGRLVARSSAPGGRER